jgi:predicted TIM-barrel fold metal-dependent hydrolase
MSDRVPCLSGAQLDRRSFLAALAASVAACSSKLVTTKYPEAPRCSEAGCTMVDVHCHVFNAADLNVSGFVSHILPVPRKLTTWFTDILASQLHKRAETAQAERSELEDIIQAMTMIKTEADSFDPGKLEEIASKLASSELLLQAGSRSEDVLATLQLIVRPRRQIAARLIEHYPQIDLFTPALVDYAYWSADKPKSPLADQLQVQAALSRASTLGLVGNKNVRIHPLAPFNPLREVHEVINQLPGTQAYQPFGKLQQGRVVYGCDADRLSAQPSAGALAPLRYAIENLGFIGAKVYPPTGFKPIDNQTWEYHADTTKLAPGLDGALHAFYAYCEAEQVPVMTHANNSNGYNLGYGILTGPEAWEPVLQAYPNLRLNLGHFGELEGDDAERGLEACELWMGRMADMMVRYPNVYADSGCSQLPVDQKFQDRYLVLLEQLYAKYDIVSLRFMYGSDFWLNKLYPNSTTYLDAFAELYKQRFGKHVKNFFGDNALRFLGFLDDEGKKPAANRNRQRLKAWYGDTTQPAWLSG